MDRKALEAAVETIDRERFGAARELLRRALADANLQIDASTRLIPAAELAGIYTFRAARARELGSLVPDLEETARVFEGAPNGAWRLVGVEGNRVRGALFLNDLGVCDACIVWEVAAEDGAP